MNNGIGLILVSHGDFAREALKSAEMIMGPQENIRVVSVYPGMDLDQVKDALRVSISEVDGAKGVIVITDILGGTPTNAVGSIIALRKNVIVLTGLNMPMILEFLGNRNEDLDELADKLRKVAQEGIVNFTKMIKKSS